MKKQEVTEAMVYAELARATEGMTPYEEALFVQRLKRRLARPPRTQRILRGGCILISPAKFKRKR